MAADANIVVVESKNHRVRISLELLLSCAAVDQICFEPPPRLPLLSVRVTVVCQKGHAEHINATIKDIVKRKGSQIAGSSGLTTEIVHPHPNHGD